MTDQAAKFQQIIGQFEVAERKASEMLTKEINEARVRYARAKEDAEIELLQEALDYDLSEMLREWLFADDPEAAE